MLAQPGSMAPQGLVGRPGPQAPAPMQLQFNSRQLQATAQRELDLLLSTGQGRPVVGSGLHAPHAQYANPGPQAHYADPGRFQSPQGFPLRPEGGRGAAPAPVRLWGEGFRFEGGLRVGSGVWKECAGVWWFGGRTCWLGRALLPAVRVLPCVQGVGCTGLAGSCCPGSRRSHALV